MIIFLKNKQKFKNILLGYSKIKKYYHRRRVTLSENEMLKLKSFLTDNFVNHQIIPILFREINIHLHVLTYNNI